jgi:ABC-2 type transport system permease protein
MGGTSALVGALRFEFAMQVRRPALWVGMALLGVLVFAAGIQAVLDDPLRGKVLTHHDNIMYWTWSSLGVMFVGVGLLCADRLRRDRRTHVDELLRAAQAPLLARLLGKHLGASLATLVPMALIYFGGVAYIAMRWGDFGVLPLAVAAFALLAVPPVLFVVAYCIASTTVLWQPLFMFLYVGFWFWANLGSDVAIPTVNGTYLSPGENYVVSGIFGFGRYRFVTQAHPDATPLQGLVNIVVLLALGALALLAAWRFLAWSAGRE